MCTVQCMVYTVHRTLYTIHCTLYITALQYSTVLYSVEVLWPVEVPDCQWWWLSPTQVGEHYTEMNWNSLQFSVKCTVLTWSCEMFWSTKSSTEEEAPPPGSHISAVGTLSPTIEDTARKLESLFWMSAIIWPPKCLELIATLSEGGRRKFHIRYKGQDFLSSFSVCKKQTGVRWLL